MFSKRFTLITVLIFLCVFTFSIAYAQDNKIGYIDSWKIFEEYKGKNEQQAQFDKEQKEWEEKATRMEQEIQELKDELENSVMWSEERRQQQREKIQQKQKELEEFVNEIWGPQGKAQRRNAELTNPIIEEIIQVVQKIGADENYSLILDVAESGIVYAKDGMDLTQRVIDILNEKYDQQQQNK